MINNLFQIRVTGILIEDGKILLLKQKVSNKRKWSLPGGKLEKGELLEQGLIREMIEETGLKTRVVKLLYVCDKPDSDPPLLHITFLIERISGKISMPTNNLEKNPIHDIQWVPVYRLNEYGFSDKFIKIVTEGFPQAGNYCGLKQNIGL